jgi:hypothetical protein
MAIDFRIGTKILKNLQASLAPATAINPYPYIGVIKNNLDPTRCGRLQVFIPELGGNPDDQANWRTVSHASPFMGYTSTEITAADIPDITNGFSHVSHTYGMWMVPPDIGVEVICVFVAGDPMRGYWIACVNSNLSRHMLPGLGSSRNIDTLNATANTKQSYTAGTQAPVVEFNENISANDINPNFYNIAKPIHETQYSILKQQGLNEDTTRGTITSSSQRETPSQVFGISTPGRPVNDPADDPNYVRDLNAGRITEDYYRVKARKGGHTFVMDDGSVLGVDQLVRLRTAGGHQVLMHDTEETIYVGHATGNSWIELSKTGSINIYSHGGFNLRSEGDINFHSDGNINLNADKQLNLHANKISNVAATYSLPDTSFNSNTGTWNSVNNQLNSIVTVAPTHEPFDRISVANTSELSSSIFVDTNQLIAANTAMKGYVNGQILAANAGVISANLGMKGYVDSVASQSSYGNVNVKAYTETMGFANYGNVNVAAYLASGIATNINITGNITANVSGFSVGYRDLPQVTAANVTLALADASKHFYANTAAPSIITVPSNANVAFPIGTTIVLVNRGSGNITIQNQGAGAPFLYLAGNATTTSSRTLTQYGMATLVKTETNLWFVNGTGLV